MTSTPSIDPRSVRFTVPGRLGGKKRAGRRFTGNKTVISFNASAREEATVAKCARHQAMRALALLTGPLALKISVWQSPPESWSKKRRARTKWIVGRPDCDNQVKLICDALNKVVWNDDAQVASLSFERRYLLDGREFIEVEVNQLEAS